MSNIEPLPLTRPVDQPAYWDAAEASATATLPPLVEHLLLFVLLSGGAGFWLAVIWWIVGRGGA